MFLASSQHTLNLRMNSFTVSRYAAAVSSSTLLSIMEPAGWGGGGWLKSDNRIIQLANENSTLNELVYESNIN